MEPTGGDAGEQQPERRGSLRLLPLPRTLPRLRPGPIQPRHLRYEPSRVQGGRTEFSLLTLSLSKSAGELANPVRFERSNVTGASFDFISHSD